MEHDLLGIDCFGDDDDEESKDTDSEVRRGVPSGLLWQPPVFLVSVGRQLVASLCVPVDGTAVAPCRRLSASPRHSYSITASPALPHSRPAPRASPLQSGMSKPMIPSFLPIGDRGKTSPRPTGSKTTGTTVQPCAAARRRAPLLSRQFQHNLPPPVLPRAPALVCPPALMPDALPRPRPPHPRRRAVTGTTAAATKGSCWATRRRASR